MWYKIRTICRFPTIVVLQVCDWAFLKYPEKVVSFAISNRIWHDKLSNDTHFLKIEVILLEIQFFYKSLYFVLIYLYKDVPFVVLNHDPYTYTVNEENGKVFKKANHGFKVCWPDWNLLLGWWQYSTCSNLAHYQCTRLQCWAIQYLSFPTPSPKNRKDQEA